MPDESPEARPYIFIPYMRPGEPIDNGYRPLPAGITFYTCSSIHLNGASYNGTPLTPGPVELSLLVSNSGALGASVTARFYLSDPVTGFKPADLLGSTEPFYVPANTMGWKSPRKVYDVPAGKEHLCLFAEAWCLLDPSTKPGNVIEDRHWGQQNLMIIAAKPGQPLKIPFTAVGQAQGGYYAVNVRPLDVREDVEPLYLPAEAIQLVDLETGNQSNEPQRVELGLWEERAFMVVVEIPFDAVPGSVTSFVVEQFNLQDRQMLPTGAVGITINII